MSRLGLLVTWLLLLAIPLQGVAASTMIACGPNHHARAENMRAHTSDSAASHHEHEREHGQRTYTFDHASDAGPSASDSTHKSTLGKSVPKGKCSICASCCHGTLMLTRLPPVKLEDFAASMVPGELSSFVDAPLRSLKRPPRA